MGLWGRRSGGEEFRRHFNAVNYRVQRAVESCLVLRHQLRVPVCEFMPAIQPGKWSEKVRHCQLEVVWTFC
jgi:hypothetical protein